MFNKRFLLFVVFGHILFILILVFLAGSEGILGQKMKALTVALIPKEKRTEPIKPKAESPKIEVPQPKIEIPRQMVAEQSKPKVNNNTAPIITAPPPTELSSIQFNDGAKNVQTISDPIQLYKTYIEYNFKSKWNRPDDINDENFEVSIELTIDNQGKIINNKWINKSGNTTWDNSIKNVFVEIKSIPVPPPKGFPLTFIIKFDTTTIME